jgi:thiol-disulfide isomerase/thioredoxin
VNRNVIFVICVVVAITGLLLLGKRASNPAANVDKGGVLAPGSGDPRKGSMAPDFALKSLPDGKTLQLSSLKGKAVLVNFWATWCEPCKAEIPWLIELQKKYGPQGLQIVGVTKEDSDEKTIANFAQKMGMNYPILVGTTKVLDSYGGIDGLPTSFFIDRSGKVVAEVVGTRSESILEDAIKSSLEQGNL